MSSVQQSAVIATGGKQYRVKVGQKLQIEKIDGEPGQKITFDKEKLMLLQMGDEILLGTPFLEKGKVEAKIVQHGRGEKIRIIKMRRRKTYRRQQGHRQSFTEIEVTSIQ